MQFKKQVFISDTEKFRADDKVYQSADLFIIDIVINCIIIHLAVMLDNLFTGFSEDVDIFIPYKLMDFYVGSIFCSHCHSPVQHEFHVTCSTCFFGCKRNLFRNITGRDQLFCQCHVVVFYHNHFQIRCNFRIVINQLLQAEDQMNDILCNNISRCSLGSKDYRDRSLRFLSALDLQIFIDHI